MSIVLEQPSKKRIETENPKFYRSILKDFCEKIGLDESYLDAAFNQLADRFTLVGYVDDHTFGAVEDYYKNTVIPHKVAVFKEGMKISKAFGENSEAVKMRLLYHDFSKFSAFEMDYAFVNFKDFKSNDDITKQRFAKAWHHHKMNNPHHPEYWFDVKKDGSTQPLMMPRRFLAEMVADWMGAGITYDNTLSEWLPQNLPKFRFHKDTAFELSNILSKYLQIETRLADDSGERLMIR